MFRVLAGRNVERVSTEVDADNVAANALLASLGAVRTESVVELALPART